MRIAVTGAAGGIGRNVVADLLEHGHTVSAVDQVAPAVGTAPAGAVTWHQGDVRDEGLMARVVDGADALIHLAALPTPLQGTPREVFATNTQATFVALEAAGVAGVARVALASSTSLLGLAWSPTPLSPLYAPVDEAHPNIGSDVYALSKEVDEATAAMMQRRHGYQVVALRIPATAPMALHLARQSEVALDPSRLSNELWSYLDVQDGARAFALAVERDIPCFHAVNVTAPDTYSALPTAELMARHHPSTPLRRPLEDRETVFDTTRCRELLGFVAAHRLSFADATSGREACVDAPA